MIKVIQTGPLGVNSLVVSLSENKVFIVDPACCSFCGDEKKITSFLAENNLEPVAIVLTHGHFDHVAGLPFLKKVYPDISVLIHKNDKFYIGAEGIQIQREQLSYIGFYDFADSVCNLCDCDGFLDDEKNLYECLSSCKNTPTNNLLPSVCDCLKDWKVLYTPGHTMGSVCLYNEKENVLISGDTLFYKSWGRTDLGGSEELIMQSLRKIKNRVDGNALVYPGHDYFGFTLNSQ